MKLTEIDRYCDLFEQRLKRGEVVSIDQFLAGEHLASVDELLVELKKVESEYQEQHRTPTYLPQPAMAGIPDRLTESMPDEMATAVIGKYKLLQKLGEGGMGVVYMAEQTEPVARRVALKIIKPGMDSKQVIARFEAERQALSLMDHPNIARVLDAGTTESGRPYFVMELVKGIPITRYCDDKQLSPRERLELFVPVCQAIQHAHQKGIIHRDLKPTNILIAQFDDHPVPKVIDFGLAKAVGQRLTQQTLFTQFGQIVGTIDYMSPEQASFNQLDVDTRTDIYSLGVLLYELLTGETPFDKKRLHQAAFDELLRIIRQEEPPRPSVRLSSHDSLAIIAANRRMAPSKLSQLVRGELDWIVMKALDKDRSRRYDTANGLSLDVQRFLTDEPVSACPPSLVYRLRKLVRRHRVAVSVSLTLTLALLLGLFGTSWQAIRASFAEYHYRIQFDRATNAEIDAKKRLIESQKSEEKARQAQARAETALFEMHTSLGLNAGTSNPAESVLRFANAAAIAKPGSPEERESRIRVSTWSRLLPTPIFAVSLGQNQRTRWIGFDSTGAHLATLTESGICTVWSLARKDSIRIPGQVICATWNPRTGQLAVGRESGAAQLLNGPKWVIDEELRTDEPVTNLVFSADGGLLAIAGKVLKVWHCENRQFHSVQWPHTGTISSAEFSSDSRYIVVSCKDQFAYLYSLTSETAMPTVTPLRHHGNLPQFLDGSRYILTQAPAESGTSLAIIDLEKGAINNLLPLTAPKSGLRFLKSHPNGKYAIAGVGDKASLVSVTEGFRPAAFYTGEYHAVAFSPDGAELALSTSDGGIQRQNLAWRYMNAQSVYPRLDTVRHLEYSPDGTYLASATEQGLICVWSNPPIANYLSKPSWPLGGRCTDLAVSPGGEYLLPTGSNETGGTLNRTRVFHTADLTPAGPQIFPGGLLLHASFSADDEHVVTANSHHELSVWNWRTGVRIMPSVKLDREPILVACSSQPYVVAVLCLGGVVEIVNLQTGHAIHTIRNDNEVIPNYRREHSQNSYILDENADIQASRQHRMLLSSDREWLVKSGNRDSNIQVRRVLTGELRYPVLQQTGTGGPIALSADDSRLASAAGVDVTIWNFQRGQRIIGPLHHPLELLYLVFSPDGRQLLTGCRDGIARLWDCETGKLATDPMRFSGDSGFDGHDTARFVGLDALVIMTVSADSTARFWSRQTGKLLAPIMSLSNHGAGIAFAKDWRQAYITGIDQPQKPTIRVSSEADAEINVLGLEDFSKPSTLPIDELQLWSTILAGRSETISGDRYTSQEWLEKFTEFQVRHPDHPSQQWSQHGCDLSNIAKVVAILRMAGDDPIRRFTAQWYLARLPQCIDPHDPRLMALQLADCRIQLKQFFAKKELVSAQKLFTSVLEARSDAPVSRDDLKNGVLIGRSYFAIGDVAAAISAFRRSLPAQQQFLGEGDSDTLATANELCGALIHKGDFAEAHKVASRLVDVQRSLFGNRDSGVFQAEHTLALVYWKEQRTDLAISLLKDVWHRQCKAFGPDHPDSVKTINSILSLLSARMEYREAIEFLTNELQVYPDSPMLMCSLGSVLHSVPDLEIRDYQKAIELTRQSTVLAPNVFTCWYCLGLAYVRSGRWREAISPLEKSNELTKGGNLARDGYLLTIAHYHLNEKEKAIEWYRKTEEWIKRLSIKSPDVDRLRDEAQDLLKDEFKSETQRPPVTNGN